MQSLLEGFSLVHAAKLLTPLSKRSLIQETVAVELEIMGNKELQLHTPVLILSTCDSSIYYLVQINNFD